mgnify:CR=1 FL=1
MAKYRFDEIAINSTEKKKPTEEDRFTYLGLEHLDSGNLKVTRFGTDVAPIGEKLVMHKGDVLFGKRRAYQKKVAIAPFDGIFSAHGMVLRPREDVIDKGFFPLFISSDYFLDAAIKISVGSLSPTINWRDLKELEFNLPDIPTQRRLAAVLWAMNETMDSYKELISATDELVKSQFIERFGDETVSECKWPVMKMSNVFSITSSRRILKSEWRTEGEIPFLRVRDMVQLANGEPLDNEFYVTEEFYNSRPDDEKVRSGDIIVSATSTIGKTYIIKNGERFYFKDADVLLFRKKEVPINETFFTYGLRMPTVWRQIEGGLGATTVAHFLISKAEKLLQPLPPIELQEWFESLVRQSDKSKFVLVTEMSALRCCEHRLPKDTRRD